MTTENNNSKTLTEVDRWLRSYCGHFDTTAVSRLDLSDKGLTELPCSISTFINLKYLNLSKNNLTNTELGKVSTRYLPLLEECDLSGNERITEIDGMILTMPKSQLRYLDCSSTSLTKLPQCMDELERLVIKSTQLSIDLDKLDPKVDYILDYPKLSWLNNEPVFTSTDLDNFSSSFFLQSRIINRHIDKGIPFDAEDSDIFYSSEVDPGSRNNSVTNRSSVELNGVELRISARHTVRKDRMVKEIDEKLQKLQTLIGS